MMNQITLSILCIAVIVLSADIAILIQKLPPKKDKTSDEL